MYTWKEKRPAKGKVVRVLPAEVQALKEKAGSRVLICSKCGVQLRFFPPHHRILIRSAQVAMPDPVRGQRSHSGGF